LTITRGYGNSEKAYNEEEAKRVMDMVHTISVFWLRKNVGCLAYIFIYIYNDIHNHFL
jgi:hypothetical protein